ncbi:UvrD-helicase domain-containing protein [Pseudomonas savastanoi]|uniref:UvrD-helicase domain-containing protein n=1 Tax=Pseudomonas savastanoi TaxID=29438 RepID=UPI000EFF2B15|nr:UvrD-helicase domain-containing protein [Pseudomonas savastanoi]RML92451.1 hypothetical protein ALQ87_02059 [Pseudomonas savastanoi pv. glycinea]
MITFHDLVPEITDEDIAWVTDLLKLRDLDTKRVAFLRSRDTLDVSACPGSGKTTLIVAKLAILARHWRSRTRGICVLSHTNVARQEIEHRLGDTDVGRRLLNYPHCIDTIHGFIRRFLATPWLLSNQFRFTAIDDELTYRMRRRCLTDEDKKHLRSYFAHRKFDFRLLRLANADFSNPTITLSKGNLPFGPKTATYQILARAVVAAAKQGYFCYDEIFVLGSAHLTEHPSVAESLRHRFPCAFIDEMQDTSATQNAYLNAIFPRHLEGICVTRVGDSNQAIFESENFTDGSDFPDLARSLEIASSFRFDNSIAVLANPLSFHPLEGGLSGRREPGENGALRHTIFVFPDDNCSGVLQAYGELVLNQLPAELHEKAVVTALGYTHKDIDAGEEVEDHYPKTVGHYWEGYDRSAGLLVYRPPTLIERIRLAKRSLAKGETTHHGVEEIAKGLLHLVNLIRLNSRIKVGSRQHVQVQQLLTDPQDLATYQGMVVELLFKPNTIDAESWPSYARRFCALASVLSEANGLPEPAREYLNWVPEMVEVEQGDSPQLAVNTYRCTHAQGVVDIKLGSIHSSKGQTHTATLILETFNHQHFIKCLLPWVAGQSRHGGRRTKKRITEHMLAMYVAMTRPTHLLCLAISRRALGEGEAYETNCQRLVAQGWYLQTL